MQLVDVGETRDGIEHDREEADGRAQRNLRCRPQPQEQHIKRQEQNDRNRIDCSQERLEHAYRAFEPFYGAVNSLLQSGSLTTYDQQRGDQRYAKVMEEWASIDGAQTSVVIANNAILHELLDAYTPEEAKALNAHQVRVLALLGELATANAEEAPRIGAAMAEELSASMPTDSAPRWRVAEVAGWLVEPTLAAGAGVVDGATVGAFAGGIALGFGATAYQSAVWALAVGALAFFVVYAYRFATRET